MERIDRDSSQLAAALAGEQARIIITTLQKFPFLLDKVGQLPARRYAVISRRGALLPDREAATELRRVLGVAAREDDDLAPDAVEDALADVVAARDDSPTSASSPSPRHPRARRSSCSATSTGYRQVRAVPPVLDASGHRGGLHPRVLANYTTYETFWRIEKTITEDPAFETAKARRAIARFVTLHEHNLAQRAEVVVEQFRQRVAHKIGGRAKAMVVTSPAACGAVLPGAASLHRRPGL